MSLLQGGAINIGGKRIPISVLIVVAVVGAALLLMRRLSSTGSSVAVGSAPVDLTGSDQVLLDQLNQTTSSLQSALGQLTGAANSQGTGTPVAQPTTFQIHPTAFGFEPNQQGEPIFSGPSWQSPIIGYLPLGTVITPTGPAVQGLVGTTDIGTSSSYLPYGGGYVSAAAGLLRPGQGTGTPIQ